MGSKRTKSRSDEQRHAAVRSTPPLDLLPCAPTARWQWGGIAALVALAAAAVYLPTLRNEFVTWDDPDYITKNASVTSPDGLASIWNPRAKHEQFYPLVFSSYWLEYRLWGANPIAYHATNLVLHALNAALLILVLRQLGLSLWAAWLAAALFAVHPLNAASVAWAAERKNVLSLLFYLLALLSYLRRTRGGGWRWYVLALALFVLALLSKTAVVTFPATALLCDRLILRRWTPRSFAHIVPFVLLGVLAAVLTHVVEQRNAGANIARLDPVWRPFAAAGALWFYVGKLLVPVNLAGVYERWDIGAHWPVFALALLAVPTAMYVIWRGRRRLPPQVPWGLAHYILALGPMLGLVSFNYTQFSFVADHFAYLPAIGLFVALAALADAARLRLTTSAPLHAPTDACSTPPRVPFTRQLVATLPTLAVLAVLGTLTWRQTATLWHDARSFWEETCRMSPNGWVGHYQLANLDAREQRWPQAAEHYRRAAEVKPDLHQACGFLGDALWKLGDRAGALAAYERGIAVVPYASTKWIDYRHTAADILAVLAREQGRPEHLQTAEKYLREAAGKPLFRAQIKLARYLRSQQRYAEAANFYQAALKVQQATPQEIATARQELAALPPQSGENVP